MLFPVITNNLNWESLTKNAVLKNEMGLRLKNYKIMGDSLKSPIFRGGWSEKPIYRGICLKGGGGGAWTASKFKGGAC